VLLVEDESLVAMVLEDMLADFGCEVVGPSANVAEALALAERGGFDLALLDVNLGDGATSFPVADRLRAMGVPFAFVTGYGVDGVRPDLRDAPVLSKPIEMAVLARILAG
jgi:CheY-like chemotaxis protein